jgi:guanosine-3',5'-bis(diphosphate) 3'-pyrophosphohydrolase
MDASSLIRKIKKYNPNVNAERILRACTLSQNAHAHQIRASGEPYFTHPLAVAEILTEMKMDEDSIITALMHDTVEDTELTIESIQFEFGEEVAKLVDGVTKLDKIKFQPDHIRQAENFRKLLLAMSEDIRVMLVKLADRLHNMRTLDFVSPEKKNRISIETLEIYAPLAERMGMQRIKNELQDLSFEILHPEERESIINRVNFLRKDGGFVVDKIESHIKKTLSDVGITAKVVGREKAPCSIWQKMRLKNISFEQLSDIIAFRVIVEDIIDCYSVLGIIHAAYHMVPGSFKDYISTPKDNGYRSLHTVVVGPNKQRIEVQVRTHEMDEVNELGVAAHWFYKQGQNHSKEGKQYRWIRELLEILDTSNSEEFLEHSKLEMYEDQVFCFTPRGDIVPLPRGAMPLDFAYALHSDIGHSCVGTKINGRIAPLKTILENGDQIEIIKSANQTPSPSWEKFVITGRAKSEIKKYIRSQKRKDYVALGKSLISKFFGSDQLEATIEKRLETSLNIFQKKTLEDLYSAVGEGTISREEVIKIIETDQKKSKNLLKRGLSFLKFNSKKKLEKSIPIRGLSPGMAINFAECCHPLPGDPIIGLMNKGEGVIIHTVDCGQLNDNNEKEKNLIDVKWERNSHENFHIGSIKAILLNEPGALATMSSVINKHRANISNIKIISRSLDFYEIMLDIEVMGVKHLTTIIASLRSKKSIHSVERNK